MHFPTSQVNNNLLRSHVHIFSLIIFKFGTYVGLNMLINTPSEFCRNRKKIIGDIFTRF